MVKLAPPLDISGERASDIEREKRKSRTGEVLTVKQRGQSNLSGSTDLSGHSNLSGHGDLSGSGGAVKERGKGPRPTILALQIDAGTEPSTVIVPEVSHLPCRSAESYVDMFSP